MFKKEKTYSWDDITISQYRKILNLKKDEDYAFNLIAVFDKCELQEVLDRPIDETLKCTAALNNFITKAPKKKAMKTSYELNGKKYLVSLNPANISTAQYFDFVNSEKKIPENLSQILAIFMVPDGKKYNTDYDIESAVYDIENFLGIEEALGVCDFFTLLYRAYSKKVLKKTKKALIQAKKAGVPETEIQQAQQKIDMFCHLIK